MYLHPSVSIVVMMKRSPGTSITSDWSITVNCKFYNGIAHMLTMVDNHTTGQRQDDDEKEETTSTLYSVVVKHTLSDDWCRACFTVNVHYEVAPSEGDTSTNTATVYCNFKLHSCSDWYQYLDRVDRTTTGDFPFYLTE